MEPDEIARKFFLQGNPNPQREGCFDTETLKAIADDTLPADHPARLHISDCSPCFREYYQFKVQRAKGVRRRRWVLVAGLTACLVVVALMAVRFRFHFVRRSVLVAEIAPVERTVDLWDQDAPRGSGEPATLEAVELPAALVRVKVVLPRFSGSGKYSIAVTDDKYGRNVRAKAAGSTVSDGPQEIMIVILDLRKTRPGAYYLETTREQGKASYYYPLKVM